MKLTLMLSLALALVLVNGFIMFALLYWPMIQERAQPFYMLLTNADVHAGEQVRSRLEAQAVRRHLWGAVGGESGPPLGSSPRFCWIRSSTAPSNSWLSSGGSSGRLSGTR